MAHSWTKAQLEAINADKGEFVVSASAGTGKTSIIIERVYQLIQNKKANIDEVLIITFTEDAAEELRARLFVRLQEEFNKAKSQHLKHFWQNQINRLSKAQVSTIHSFCLRILQENYHLLGLPETFTILSPEQVTLLKHRILEEVFEQMYADESERGEIFRRLVTIYGGRKIDEGLKQTVLNLYNFLQTIADPESWLRQVIEQVEEIEKGTYSSELALYILSQNIWLPKLYEAYARLKKLSNRLDDSIQTILDHIEMIEHTLQNTIKELTEPALAPTRASDSESSESLTDTLTTVVLSLRLPPTPKVKQNDKWDEISRKELSQIKSSIRQVMNEIDRFCPPDIDILKAQTPYIRMILTLCDKLDKSFTEEKQKENVLEYDDLQRLALKILSDPTTNISEKYQELFKYVLVDEYQDVNELQDKIIRKVCRKKTDGYFENLFIVGDVKQSIYRFRLAEPEIFQRLCAGAEEDRGPHRIDLRENFRSRIEIINTANAIFGQLMSGGPFEINYTDSHELLYKAEFPRTDDNKQYKTELHIIERQLEDSSNSYETDTSEASEIIEYEARVREAYFVAEYVDKLLRSKLKIYQDGQIREIQPDDIAILLRTLKYTANEYIRMLREKNIPVIARQIEAFLELPEIADMVALLDIIYNPYQDIPLVAVLRSPIVGVGTNELAKIRTFARGHYFTALKKYVLKTKDANLTKFLENLTRWRRLANRANVAELISQIYVDTNYPEFAGLDTQNDFAEDNLNQFMILARNFSNSAGTTLKDFIEYLELIGESELTPSEVSAASAGGVKVASIHSAKGLEFPVVIISDIGKQFNLRDTYQNILFDKKLSMGMRYLSEDGKLEDTPILSAIRLAKVSQIKAEELRLLYVAMTRAKEKLILTGNAEIRKLFEKLELFLENDIDITHAAMNKKTPLEWLILALSINHPESFKNYLNEPVNKSLISTPTMDIYLYSQADQEQWNLTKSKRQASELEQVEKIIKQFLQKNPSPRAREIAHQLSWEYPDKALTSTPAKISVTEFAKERSGFNNMEDESAELPAEPAELDFRILDEEDSNRIEKGVVWHKFMEKIRLDIPIEKENILSELNRLADEGILTSSQIKFINPEQVENFFHTAPGKLMLSYPENVHREQEFTYLIPAKSLPDPLRIGESDEPVLVHGIIDCLIVLENGIVIIDYKTSQIASSEVDEKTRFYRPQIELYARAMGEILKKPIISAWLYFTEPNAAVQVI